MLAHLIRHGAKEALVSWIERGRSTGTLGRSSLQRFWGVSRLLRKEVSHQSATDGGGIGVLTPAKAWKSGIKNQDVKYSSAASAFHYQDSAILLVVLGRDS
jgi:hypothetical protein